MMSSTSLSNVFATPLKSEWKVAEESKENETPGNQFQQPAEESTTKMSRPRRVLQDVQPSDVSEFQLKGPSFLDKFLAKELHGPSETERRDELGSSELNDVAPLDLRQESAQTSLPKHMVDGRGSILGKACKPPWRKHMVLERNKFFHFSIPVSTAPRKCTSQLSGSTDPKDFNPLELNFKDPEADAVSWAGWLNLIHGQERYQSAIHLFISTFLWFPLLAKQPPACQVSQNPRTSNLQSSALRNHELQNLAL